VASGRSRQSRISMDILFAHARIAQPRSGRHTSRCPPRFQHGHSSTGIRATSHYLRFSCTLTSTLFNLIRFWVAEQQLLIFPFLCCSMWQRSQINAIGKNLFSRNQRDCFSPCPKHSRTFLIKIALGLAHPSRCEPAQIRHSMTPHHRDRTRALPETQSHDH